MNILGVMKINEERIQKIQAMQNTLTWWKSLLQYFPFRNQLKIWKTHTKNSHKIYEIFHFDLQHLPFPWIWIFLKPEKAPIPTKEQVWEISYFFCVFEMSKLLRAKNFLCWLKWTWKKPIMDDNSLRRFQSFSSQNFQLLTIDFSLLSCEYRSKK